MYDTFAGEYEAQLNKTSKGASIVQKNMRDVSVIDSLTTQEIKASTMNADLRKKLRVDRARKQTAGVTTSGMSVEDPSQPDWLKHKSLREIEVIRETKKDLIVNNLFGGEGQGSTTMYITPGENNFFTHELRNGSSQSIIYTVRITDPDVSNGSIKRDEMSLVSDSSEFMHWVQLGKVSRPSNFSCITRSNDIKLLPSQSIELLFKYYTSRDTEYAKAVPSSARTIKPRRI
jgi:hypothetical protein